MMEKMIHVGFGEYKISQNPDAVLVCFGLGSCVAVSFYDERKRLGGMIHVVLPTSHGKPSSAPARFADTGIPLLLEEMIKLGAQKSRLRVNITGGAKILKLQSTLEQLDIGFRNVQKCLEVLKQLQLPIYGQETGGTMGRTVRFYINTGKTVVRHRGETQT